MYVYTHVFMDNSAYLCVCVFVAGHVRVNGK